MSDLLLLEKTAPVASIIFNRPDKANALEVSWLNRMTSFLGQVALDAAIRCVLLRANGKHFMAGGDLEMLGAMAKLPPAERASSAQESIRQCNALIRAMREFPKPIIASVQGGVAGSAVGLVAACDFVVAADNCFFVLAHVSLGASNDGLATYFLPRQIGTRKTLELALLGDRLGAADAKAHGLVNFVVPAAELESETNKLAARLAAGPTFAYGLIKSLVDAAPQNSLAAQGQLEMKLYAKAARTNDLVEGINAILSKRAARFTGS